MNPSGQSRGVAGESNVHPGLARLYETVAERARASGVFANVDIRDGMLVCEAQGSAAPAYYRLEPHGNELWVSLVTADRWLSESIEADLMFTGDDLEDLIDEELADQGFTDGPLACEHFRSEDKLFTFRSRLPISLDRADDGESASIAAQCLLGYEACFRQLGDMEESDED